MSKLYINSSLLIISHNHCITSSILPSYTLPQFPHHYTISLSQYFLLLQDLHYITLHHSYITIHHITSLLHHITSHYITLHHSYITIHHSYITIHHSYITLHHSYITLHHSYVMPLPPSHSQSHFTTHNLSRPPQHQVWLHPQLSGSHGCCPSMVRLDAAASDDTVTTTMQSISQKELQFANLQWK